MCTLQGYTTAQPFLYQLSLKLYRHFTISKAATAVSPAHHKLIKSQPPTNVSSCTVRRFAIKGTVPTNQKKHYPQQRRWNSQANSTSNYSRFDNQYPLYKPFDELKF